MRRTRWWQKRATNAPLYPTPTRPPKYPTPESLWRAACQYFKWVEDNPLYEEQLVFHKGQKVREKIPRPRPFTLEGFCTFLGMTKYWWYYTRRVKKERGEEGYLVVMDMVEQILYQQKFEGAVLGFFNPGLVARSLGLREVHELTGPQGGPLKAERVIDPSKLTVEQLHQLVQAIEQIEQADGKGKQE